MSKTLDKRFIVTKIFPNQFAIFLRVFEDGYLTSHPDNNSLSAYTIYSDSEEHGTTTILGHNEKGETELIWHGKTGKVMFESAQRKNYEWAKKQAKRMSREYGFPVRYSPFFDEEESQRLK